MTHLERTGPSAREQFSLDGFDRVAIGRSDDCDIALDDPACSRVHAELERVGSVWTITDLNSSNGTQVQGEPLAAVRRLHHGDEITIGHTMLRFVNSADLMAARTEPIKDRAPSLTRTELEVLVELCRPLYMPGSAFKVPATAKEIADVRYVGIGAIQMTLLSLYDKFAVAEGPARRQRLAETAVQGGVISPRHYVEAPDRPRPRP